MKDELLRRLPPETIRALARRKGYPGGSGDDLRDVAHWLLEHYLDEVGRSARGQAGSLVGRARKSLDSIRRRVRGEETLEETRGEGSPKSEDAPKEAPVVPPGASTSLPADPAMRTRTLAHVYESQGMYEEALSVLEEISRRDSSRDDLLEDIERVRRRLSESPEGPAGRPSSPMDLPDLEELPVRHGVDEAVLLMVTPTLLYACWEVTKSTEERVRAEVGSADVELGLRVFRVDLAGPEPNIAPYATRSLQSTVGEFFLHGVEPQTLYHAEIGWMSGDRFVAMVRSNATATPASGPQDRVDEHWMDVDQGPLDSRGSTTTPIRIVSEEPVNPRAMALARLQAIGPEAYSSLTGIDLERIREILGSMPEPVEMDTGEVGSSSGGARRE